MDKKRLKCENRRFTAEINLPASKSISNRLLIMQALSKNNIRIENVSQANDSVLLQNLLQKISNSESHPLLLDAKDAGTTFRFLTAYLCTLEGEYLLTGSAQMQQRPIGILVDALRQLGAKIKYQQKEGYPPLIIQGGKLHAKDLSIDAHISSQYISAILLISPYFSEGIKITLNQNPSSLPYIDMTIALMQKFGVKIERNDNRISVEQGTYKTANIQVEADWSSAAFWYQAVAFSEQGHLLLKGLSKNSIQGDSALIDIFTNLGVKTTEVKNGLRLEKTDDYSQNINIDFKAFPDIALSVINTCAGLGVIGSFTGLESLKIKESNRIAVLMSELNKLGFDFREIDDGEWVLINSCKVNKQQYDFSNIDIKTYDDHRVAMSFAPFAILGKGINIENAGVVIKSYPNFWKEFNKISSFA
ncbi:MAG: 3-phosphoshikimate 1-carboxyvinyltransferase [Bacteroidetes bacterium]|nr:MAG: 3-phosphoshikimate 1-carboxyvinyltransferase [Bacteroidota bacterium]